MKNKNSQIELLTLIGNNYDKLLFAQKESSIKEMKKIYLSLTSENSYCDFTEIQVFSIKEAMIDNPKMNNDFLMFIKKYEKDKNLLNKITVKSIENARIILNPILLIRNIQDVFYIKNEIMTHYSAIWIFFVIYILLMLLTKNYLLIPIAFVVLNCLWIKSNKLQAEWFNKVSFYGSFIVFCPILIPFFIFIMIPIVYLSYFDELVDINYFHSNY